MSTDSNACNSLSIIEITAPNHLTDSSLNAARSLFRDYQNYLKIDLCFQGFEQELASLPGKYAAPKGAILLAQYQQNRRQQNGGQQNGDQQNWAGCVAVRPIEGSTCEMKRLYVPDQFRGLGIGKALALAVIEKAKQLGYQKMQLDTLQSLQAAMGIYRQLGFYQIEAYYQNPLDQVVYWQLDLI